MRGSGWIAALGGLATSLLFSSVAHAADWRVGGSIDDSDLRSVWFVDVATMQVSGTHVRFWLDTRQSPPVQGISQFLTLRDLDCANRTYYVLRTSSYRDRQLLDDDLRHVGPISPVPDSVDEQVTLHACSRTFMTGPVDRDQFAAIFFKMK